jgi:hypothetical protein
MSSLAAFELEGSVSGTTASTAYGHDAVAGETLTMRLEASPGSAIQSAVYSMVFKDSAGASDLVFSPVDGVPTPDPWGDVSVTVPSGVRAYLLRCIVNGGVDASGDNVSSWTFERIVVVRSASGTRKMIPTERTQYDAVYGWAGAINKLVDMGGPDFGSLNIVTTGYGAFGATPGTSGDVRVTDSIYCTYPNASASGRLASVADVTGDDWLYLGDPTHADYINPQCAAAWVLTVGGVSYVMSAFSTSVQLGTNITLDLKTHDAYFKPRRVRQATIPTPQADELLVWSDSDDDSVHLVYNDDDAGVVSVTLS